MIEFFDTTGLIATGLTAKCACKRRQQELSDAYDQLAPFPARPGLGNAWFGLPFQDLRVS